MDNFINILQKAKEAELEELKKTLTKKRVDAVSQMESEISMLKKSITDKAESDDFIAKQQAKYKKIKTNDFIELEVKNKIAKVFFDKLIIEQFESSKFEQFWIENNLKQIINYNKGTIKTSADTKKLISKSVDKHDLEIDKDIKKGFIFENDNIEVDMTYKTYFDNFYNENKSKIFEILFK